MTILRAGGAAAHWQGVIQRCQRGEAEVLKSDDGSSVLALPGASGSSGLVVKRWELRTLAARLKSDLQLSRAWRHWKGAARLTRAGVRTATCFAIARSREGGVAVEWLVMDRLPGKTLLQHMADRDLTVKQEHALARTLGASLSRLAQHQTHNRDGKPSNWIVTNPDRAEAAVVDTVGVSGTAFLPAGLRSWRVMLASLAIEPKGCRCPARRSVQMRVVASFVEATPLLKGNPQAMRVVRRRLWRAAALRIADHGDPTPKVNPLK